ncbi:hypothetical protein L227DRAFT_614458 [Lentinus tigrinus ALCF2SS1-6]|uniref:Uncharacterized protein n=1 Tax=Lentinus tigrinus ALCF2SS1-6 TaxID=1328759 RepID=A0A5C2RZU3_9APHY|nr:hypothetical protein L227DRAFT_614458 [Lentinus tigrinus ALCF2SS1-6]
MSDDDIQVPQLQHLDRCKKCPAGWLTIPYLCKGGSVLENKNRWYRMCFNKLSGTGPLTCQYFRWRDEIHKGKQNNPNAGKACPGYVCRITKATRKINVDKHAHAAANGPCYTLPQEAVLPTIQWPPYWQPPVDASASTPQSGSALTPPRGPPLPPAPERASSPGADGPAPHLPPRGRGRAPRARGGRGSRAAQSADRSDSPHPTTAPCIGSNHQGSYAVSISPAYSYTLMQTQMMEQQRVEQAAMAKQAGQTVRSVDIFWWDQDGQAARQIRVHVPHDPWFHPRDSTHLVNRFSLKAGSLFQFYDWRKETWLDGGYESVPLHVDTSGELHYRTTGVTWSPEMPGSGPVPSGPAFNPSLFGLPTQCNPPVVTLSTPSSRTLGKARVQDFLAVTRGEDECDASSTPTPYQTSEVTTWHAYRSTSLTTPSTVRASRSITPSTRFSTPSSTCSDWPTPSHPSRPSTPVLVDDWATLSVSDPLSVAITTGSQTTAVLPPRCSERTGSNVSASSSTSIVDNIGLDLDPAPRGTSRAGWPWLYACDMIAGFQALSSLTRTAGVTQPQAFAVAFSGHTFVRATFAENYQGYNVALAHMGEIQQWKSLGRTDSGKWTEFRKQWGRKRGA